MSFCIFIFYVLCSFLISLELFFSIVLELKANNEKFRVSPASHCCRKFTGSLCSMIVEPLHCSFQISKSNFGILANQQLYTIQYTSVYDRIQLNAHEKSTIQSFLSLFKETMVQRSCIILRILIIYMLQQYIRKTSNKQNY